MIRQIAIVGAPSSIGIRPYDEGGMRRLDLAPARHEKALGLEVTIYNPKLDPQTERAQRSSSRCWSVAFE
jgi:hypothetical protein